ncbi:NADP-dependent oxidoreductase [Chryseobacterium populi]|uniref:Zn-dependent oxidoreductase, NADPH:quinone reductase n=1 Tax=Chryseobacterium populi TaxID=1144316 RepID=J2T0C5_9FLAO|nr:NADP-dependent oxidoreductase [Chryseobacterium populi]EJL71412.1 Zn-dependent oxidoreductase, NADPH:quinone reductase [Chryseobacterium populi]
MKAMILSKAGNVNNLKIAEIPQPAIKPDEVLIKVKAISINPVDVKARAYEGVLEWIYKEEKEIILGWDISGEVVEIGHEVNSFQVGDEVFGMVNFFGNGKAYAQYVTSPQNHLALKPEGISHEEAAGISMVGSTAYQALVEIAKIKKGDKVLIHAASGGVGHIAVQLAKYFGAYVMGTSSAKNREFVLSLGADEHIDYTTGNLVSAVKDIDIVIDTIQGQALSDSMEVMRPGGTIVTLPTPEIPEEIKSRAEERHVNIEFMMVESKKETILALAQLLSQGVVKTHIHKKFAFEDMRNAHLEVETGRVRGKVIVVI